MRMFLSKAAQGVEELFLDNEKLNCINNFFYHKDLRNYGKSETKIKRQWR